MGTVPRIVCPALLLSWLALLPAPAVVASELRFLPLGTDRGVEASVISALLVGPDGFLWIGSREGLYRYDGYTAIRFAPNPDDQDSISDTDIRQLYRAPSDGSLWVATNTGGLNRMDPVTGRFTSWRHDSKNAETLSNDSVYGMVEDNSGRLWAGTQVGLNRYDPERDGFKRFLHDAQDARSLTNNYVYPLATDPEGRVWAGTVGGGISRHKPGTEGFDRLDLSPLAGEEENLNDVFALSWLDGDGMYAGTRGGLVRIDAQSGQARRIPRAEGALRPVVTALARDGSGRLLVGTMVNGVLIYDPALDEITPASDEPLGADGQLPAVPVLSIAVDGDSLFVGTWGGGIFRARLGRSVFRSVVVDDGADVPGRLRNRNVTAVLAGDTPGVPLVGTFGGGLQRLDVESGEASGMPGETPELVLAGIMSIANTPSGLLAGATDGLWLLPADGAPAVLFRGGEEHGLGAGYVTSLLPRGDDLWVGVGGSGLFRMRGAQPRFEGFTHEPERADSLSGDYVTALLDGEGGRMFVGTRSSGLNLCLVSTMSCNRMGAASGLGNYRVTALHRDRSGRLWAGTDGAGLALLSGEAQGALGVERRWTREDGILSDGIMAIVDDSDGSLWLSTREGLSRLDPATSAIENFVEESGLVLTHFNGGVAARDAAFIYFGAVGGLLAIPVDTTLAPRQPSKVQITTVQRTAEDGGRGAFAPVHDRYTVPWGEVLSIEFAVLDFSEKPHEYAYRMDDEEAWVSLGSRRDITFFGLTPGRHEFSVRGRDVFGVWGRSEPLLLEIVPPFWMNTWFQALALVILLSLVVLFYQARMRGLQRRNAALYRLQLQRERALKDAERSQSELEAAYEGLRNLTARLESAKEDERREVARELHDELGQSLTVAKMNVQMANRQADAAVGERLKDAVSMLDGMIKSVRNLSLTLRPPLLDEAGLAPALAYYLDAVAERTGVQIDFEAGPDVAGNTPESRTTAFRVVQEAVGNALRHSGADLIRVELQGTEGELEVKVIDNGCGFDGELVQERTRRGEHLGILGMSERVRSMGGTLELRSRPGEGCCVTARIPR